jgi:hypothetical protein
LPFTFVFYSVEIKYIYYNCVIPSDAMMISVCRLNVYNFGYSQKPQGYDMYFISNVEEGELEWWL